MNSGGVYTGMGIRTGGSRVLFYTRTFRSRDHLGPPEQPLVRHREPVGLVPDLPDEERGRVLPVEGERVVWGYGG